MPPPPPPPEYYSANTEADSISTESREKREGSSRRSSGRTERKQCTQHAGTTHSGREKCTRHTGTRIWVPKPIGGFSASCNTRTIGNNASDGSKTSRNQSGKGQENQRAVARQEQHEEKENGSAGGLTSAPSQAEYGGDRSSYIPIETGGVQRPSSTVSRSDQRRIAAIEDNRYRALGGRNVEADNGPQSVASGAKDKVLQKLERAQRSRSAKLRTVSFANKAAKVYNDTHILPPPPVQPESHVSVVGLSEFKLLHQKRPGSSGRDVSPKVESISEIGGREPVVNNIKSRDSSDGNVFDTKDIPDHYHISMRESRTVGLRQEDYKSYEVPRFHIVENGNTRGIDFRKCNEFKSIDWNGELLNVLMSETIIRELRGELLSLSIKQRTGTTPDGYIATFDYLSRRTQHLLLKLHDIDPTVERNTREYAPFYVYSEYQRTTFINDAAILHGVFSPHRVLMVIGACFLFILLAAVFAQKIVPMSTVSQEYTKEVVGLENILPYFAPSKPRWTHTFKWYVCELIVYRYKQYLDLLIYLPNFRYRKYYFNPREQSGVLQDIWREVSPFYQEQPYWRVDRIIDEIHNSTSDLTGLDKEEIYGLWSEISFVRNSWLILLYAFIVYCCYQYNKVIWAVVEELIMHLLACHMRGYVEGQLLVRLILALLETYYRAQVEIANIESMKSHHNKLTVYFNVAITHFVFHWWLFYWIPSMEFQLFFHVIVNYNRFAYFNVVHWAKYSTYRLSNSVLAKPKSLKDRSSMRDMETSTKDEFKSREAHYNLGLVPDYIRPVAFAPNRNNEKQATQARVLKATPKPSNKRIKKFIKWFRANKTKILGKAKIKPVSIDEYLENSNASKAVKATIRKAYDEAQLQGINYETKLDQKTCRKWTTRKSFVKVENLGYRTITRRKYKAPRLIQGASPEFIAHVGPWIQACQTYLKKRWGHDKFMCFTSSVPADIIAARVVSRFEAGWDLIEDDVSAWDSSVMEELCKLEVEVARHLGAPPLVCQLMLSNCLTLGMTSCGLQYRVPGTRKSGDPYTSLFNTMWNMLIHLHILVETQGWSYRDLKDRVVMNGNGDDNIFAAKLNRYVDWTAEMKKYGFEAKPWYRTRLEDVEYCSNKIWPAGSECGYTFGPKPGKVLGKLGWFINPPMNQNPDSIMRGVAIGLKVTSNHIPPIRAVADAIIKKTKGAYVVEGPKEDWKMLYREYGEDDQVWPWLSTLYDWDKGDQERLEKFLETWKFGEGCDDPNFLEMVGKDVGL